MSENPYRFDGQYDDPNYDNSYTQPPYGNQQYAQHPYAPAPGAPFGVDPLTGIPYSEKSKIAAGLLGIFLGGLGVGRFYTGHIGLGVAQLVVTLVTFGFGSLWGFIDGIIMLASNPTDAEGRPLR